MLEESPAHRGGHLWIIYSDLVETSAARHHISSIAPQLAKVPEYWPGPPAAKRWNKVRLPGAKYVRPGVSAWCQLVSVTTGETSADGRSAARLLLASQTPASMVPAAPTTSGQAADQAQASMLSVAEVNGKEDLLVEQQEPQRPALTVTAGGAGELPNSDQDQQNKMQPGTDRVDTQWYERYNTPEGKRFWFHWTPQYLAAWWNDRHAIDELLPSERNGYGLASWRGERTASVAKRGAQWADFGSSARRDDGSPDTGDALELHVRLSGAPKPEVMRSAARELLQEARQALESAARAGQPLPSWLEEIVTDAGLDRYARIANQAGHLGDAMRIRTKRHEDRNEKVLGFDDQAWASTSEPQASSVPVIGEQGGLPGFAPLSQAEQESKVPPGNKQRQRRETAQAVPLETNRTHDISEVLVAEPVGMHELEMIRDYGRAHEWAALVIGREEIIPAGRADWLDFVWLSHKKDQQRRVFEYIKGRSQSRE